jgi:hypothetical protein
VLDTLTIFCAGGIYANPTEEAIQTTAATPKDNDYCESIFGITKYYLKLCPNANTLFINALVKMKKNKCLTWLFTNFTKEERDQISRKAMKSYTEYARTVTEQEKKESQQRAEEYKQEIKSARAKAARKLEKVEAYGKVVRCRNKEEVEEKVKDMRKNEKMDWLKEQLNCYKNVPQLKVIAERKGIKIAFSKAKRQFKAEELQATLCALLLPLPEEDGQPVVPCDVQA